MGIKRHLDGKGNGEFIYDYQHDIFTFKIKNRDYKISIEFQNFTLDIDNEGFPIGVRIFDASQVFDVSKLFLKSAIHVDFAASIEENVASVRINIVSKIRNRLMQLIPGEANITDLRQQLTVPINPRYGLKDSTVES